MGAAAEMRFAAYPQGICQMRFRRVQRQRVLFLPNAHRGPLQAPKIAAFALDGRTVNLHRST